MVVLRPQSEFGHAPPPQTPYSIISNLGTWEENRLFREGDPETLGRLVHIYPRLKPTHYAARLCDEIGRVLGAEHLGVQMYLNPDLWPFTKRHITLPQRRAKVLKQEDVSFRCVDVASHRLYVVLYAKEHAGGVSLAWAMPGLGLSIRGAEQLLEGVGEMREVAVVDGQVPEPTWTPETEAHQGVKSRIIELLHHAAIEPSKIQATPKDVFLYPTGMGAIFHGNRSMLKYRPGTIVVSGVIFHNSYHHLIEECPHGFKHFGRFDDQGISDLEAWLESEKQEGKAVSYLIVEFPANPTLETPDIARIKRLSEKYGFVLIGDDTVAGFGNIDIFPQCDVLLTSLTKSFSGRANVMGGSITLNPLSAHYAALSSLFASSHHNELFHGDAQTLLDNSQGFFERTRILNRNAEAVAAFLHQKALDPSSPVINVQYPTVSPSKSLYDAYKRRPSPELPEPGYGCLLTVEFDGIPSARAFYDRCGFYPGPHLGGHVTIQYAYNMAVFGKHAEELAYFREFGVKEEAVRISVGLEDVEDLLDTLRDALEGIPAVEKE